MAESSGFHPGVRGFDSRSRRCEQSQYSEVTRPDEDTVLKTAAGQTVVGSSPTASASTWERFHTGGCNPSAFNCVVVGERCDSLRSHFQTRPWCNGSTADSKPVSQGSNPWGRALRIDKHSPVVQRLRRLFYTQETMVRFHPGLLACPGTPTGRATRLKPECLQVRSLLWVLKTYERGEPLARHCPLQTRNTWGARPTGRRLFCKQKIGVRFPGAPLISITAR